jgi:hypothetical protein
LSYELPAPSTAIVDRKQSCRAYPSSASTLSFTGTKSVRIRIGGEDFIDPSSLRIMFTINNTGTGVLRPETGPWGVWAQAFLRSNGVELDNIPYYGRFHQQYGFTQLNLMDQQAVGNEGLGSSKLNTDGQYDVSDILQSKSFTCMHRLHFSLLSAGKLLPVKYAPLEIELSMISVPGDWLLLNEGASNNFQLENIQVLYDGYTLDESVLQAFYSALLRNKVMSIGTMNAYQVVHPIPSNATSYSFSSVRAFSRLAQVWLTFRKSTTAGRNYEFVCPGVLPGDTDVNNLPVENTAVPQARLSIGPHNWPDPSAVTTSAEYHMMLTKALGYSPNISRKYFEEKAFTIVWDIKKNPGDPTSAVSTRSGDLVRVQLDNLTAGHATEVWMTLISFSVCAIREQGVTLLS